MGMTIGTMFAAPTNATVLWELSPQWLKRNNRRMTKSTLRTIPLEWKKRFMMLHFKVGAELRYQYKKRSDRYLRQKAKSKAEGGKGHKNPIAYTWRTRNRLVVQKGTVAGTATRAKGAWKVPWYIKMIPKTRNAPNLGKELTATRPLEAEILKAIYVRNFEQFLRKSRRSSATRRRIS
jgi:hypothetical protein